MVWPTAEQREKFRVIANVGTGMPSGVRLTFPTISPSTHWLPTAWNTWASIISFDEMRARPTLEIRLRTIKVRPVSVDVVVKDVHAIVHFSCVLKLQVRPLVDALRGKAAGRVRACVAAWFFFEYSNVREVSEGCE